MQSPLLVLVVMMAQPIEGLDPVPPKWLPNKDFRTKGETRWQLEYIYEGIHTCSNETDPFPSTACLDRSNYKLSKDLHRCAECTKRFHVWSATFCSEAPINNQLFTQYVEYKDDQCQEVADYNNSIHMKTFSTVPPSTCGAYTDCTAECDGPNGGRSSPGCRHQHGKNYAECKADSECTWRTPPFRLYFSMSYMLFGEYTPPGYACSPWSKCQISENGSSLSTCEQTCHLSILV